MRWLAEFYISLLRLMLMTSWRCTFARALTVTPIGESLIASMDESQKRFWWQAVSKIGQKSHSRKAVSQGSQVQAFAVRHLLIRTQ
jgi:hypothetical protein